MTTTSNTASQGNSSVLVKVGRKVFTRYMKVTNKAGYLVSKAAFEFMEEIANNGFTKPEDAALAAFLKKQVSEMKAGNAVGMRINRETITELETGAPVFKTVLNSYRKLFRESLAAQGVHINVSRN